MTAVAKEAPPLSVEDYLRAEASSEIKHEYVGGLTHAMTGTSVAHNLIALNIAVALKSYLREGPCQVFVSDVKVRLNVAAQDVFYYPDVFVSCRHDERENYYRRFPNTVIEVLSEATERTDRREKFLAYQTIESLQEYVLVAQGERHVTVFRRDNGWRAEDLSADAILTLPSLRFTMTLVDVYEGVTL